MKTQLIFLCMIVVILMPFTAKAQEKKQYTIGMHFTSSAGSSSSGYLDAYNQIVDMINDEMEDFEIVLKRYPEGGDLEAFLNNEIDIANLWPSQVYEVLQNGGDVYYLYRLSYKQYPRYAACLWKRRDGDIEDINDVFGKTLIRQTYNTAYMVTLRQYLYDNGIDKPLWKVFKSFIKSPSHSSAMMALAMEKADLFWTGGEGEIGLKVSSPQLLAKVEPSFCTDKIYGRNTIVFNKNTVPEDDFLKVRALVVKGLKNLESYTDKYPDLKSFLALGKLYDVKIVPARDNEFELDFQLYEKAKKNGWWDEVEYLCDAMNEAPTGQEIVIKPDMEYCEKVCAKDDSDCIINCLK